MSYYALNLVYFGSGAFGLPTLQRLSQTHRILAVVTQPDRPAGRKRVLTPTPIGQWAQQHLPEADLIKPESVNEAEVLERLRSYECAGPHNRSGAWIVIAFGQKLSQRLLADRFAINLHASLLPRWRGAAPINHAILAGDAATGNSVITLADRMDAGLILGQSRRPIDPQVTAGELHDRLAEDGPDLVESVLSKFASNTLEPREQNPAEVTIAPKLSKQLGYLDLSQLTAEQALRAIHGLNPWPGVTVRFRSEPLKLHRARILNRTDSGEPGRIADPVTGTVRCADGTLLQLLAVQPAGRPEMTYEAFANGSNPNSEEPLERFQEAQEPC